MSNRNLFDELGESLREAKRHSENKLTLKSHAAEAPKKLEITPAAIKQVRNQCNMSRGLFAQYLHTSSRTLENWEQGRSKPNEQAVTLLMLVKAYPETLENIANLQTD